MIMIARQLAQAFGVVLVLAAFAHGEPPPSVGRELDAPSKLRRTDPYGDPLPPGAIARLGTVRFRNGNTIFAMAFTPDGKYLATDAGSDIRLWETATGKQVRLFRGQPFGITCLDISSDGKVLAAGNNDGNVRLWELATGKEIRRMNAHAVPGVRSLAFSPDGKILATTSFGGRIRLWNVAGGEKIREIAGDGSKVHAIAFSPDGQLLATGDFTTVVFWNAAKGTRIGALPEQREWPHSFAFSTDGKYLAHGNGLGDASLWDMTDRKVFRRFTGHKSPITCIAFTPDSKNLVAGNDDGTVRLWEVASARTIDVLKGGYGITALAFSPNSRLLASGDWDHTIRLWDFATGKEIRQLKGHLATITSLTFSADGRLLASGSDDTSVLLWDVADVSRNKPPKKVLQPRELENLWADLANTQAVRAHPAIWTLIAAAEQSVPLVGKKVQPALPPDERRLAALLADLEDPRFAVREKATRELEKWAELAEPALRRRLDEKPPLEARRRIQQLLEGIAGPITSAARLQELRAVIVLEHAATPRRSAC